MNKEEWEDYKNLSSQITEKLDNTSTYESWLIIQEYIDRCQQEKQSLKDRIEKAIEYIENSYYSKNTINIGDIAMTTNKCLKIREILKGDK